MSDIGLWMFLPVGYLATVLIETPMLMVGLSSRHPQLDRILAGFWLTACTYPIVVLVLPAMLDVGFAHWQYLVVAETFAPAAECLLFWLAYCRVPAVTAGSLGRDLAVIVIANLASFGIGEAFYVLGWSGMLSS